MPKLFGIDAPEVQTKGRVDTGKLICRADDPD